ncbi:MAG TPA: hypothetical protein VHX16_13645 [Chloroflexota bacterium]|jgi:hypothetical protein|nr:hypothetical protein [Chloroflexota bacterium]
MSGARHAARLPLPPRPQRQVHTAGALVNLDGQCLVQLGVKRGAAREAVNVALWLRRGNGWITIAYALLIPISF